MAGSGLVRSCATAVDWATAYISSLRSSIEPNTFQWSRSGHTNPYFANCLWKMIGWFRPLVVGLARATVQISPDVCSMLGEVGRGVDPKCSPTPPSGQALAASLKSNGSLEWLELHSNNIGDRGAEALLAEWMPARWCRGMNDSLGIAGADVARRVIFKGFGVKFVWKRKAVRRCCR